MKYTKGQSVKLVGHGAFEGMTQYGKILDVKVNRNIGKLLYNKSKYIFELNTGRIFGYVQDYYEIVPM